MKKELISIIVPVYNVRNYLPKCLDSILCQSYTDIEVIVVDDGSTDGSESICDVYAAKDTRITVIHQSNKGLSAARNVGLASARGEYIGFVDSDDWVSPVMYDRLYDEIIKYDADIAICRVYHATNKGIYYKKVGYSNQIKLFSRKESLISLLILTEISCRACDKLFRRSSLPANPFPHGKYYEDLYSIFDIISLCNTIIFIDTPYYYYYMRENSITHTFNIEHLTHHFEAAIYRNKKIELSCAELKPLVQKSQVVYNVVLYLSLTFRSKMDKDVEKLADAIVEDMKKYPYALIKGVAVKYLPGALLLRYCPAGFFLYSFAFETLKLMLCKGGINRMSFKRVGSLLR